MVLAKLRDEKRVDFTACRVHRSTAVCYSAFKAHWESKPSAHKFSLVDMDKAAADFAPVIVSSVSTSIMASRGGGGGGGGGGGRR